MGETERLATEACDLVRTELEDDLLAAAGYYTEDGVETVFKREDIRQQYTDEELHDILDSARLESVAQLAYESHHQQKLSATIRAYETLSDVTIPLEEHEGIVLSLTCHDGYSFQDVLELLEATFGEETVGIDPEHVA